MSRDEEKGEERDKNGERGFVQGHEGNLGGERGARKQGIRAEKNLVKIS